MRKIWQNMLFAQIFLTIYYIMFSIETLLYSFCISRFSFTDTDDSQGSRGMEGLFCSSLLLSTTSNLPQTFRHLFATLHMR